jgi:hypothetical protein
MNKHAKKFLIQELKCIKDDMWHNIYSIDMMLTYRLYEKVQECNREDLIEGVYIREQIIEELDKIISLYESKE